MFVHEKVQQTVMYGKKYELHIKKWHICLFKCMLAITKGSVHELFLALKEHSFLTIVLKKNWVNQSRLFFEIIYVDVCIIFATFQSYIIFSFQQITFILGYFINFKALFQKTDFYFHWSESKVEKIHGTVYFRLALNHLAALLPKLQHLTSTYPAS